MVDYQSLSIVLTGLGIMGAIIYYTLTLRNANRTQRTQLFMHLFEQLNTEESMISIAELINQEIGDYDDFILKYDSSVNPEHYAKRFNIWQKYHQIGELLRMGIIDPELVHRLQMAPVVIAMWEKWGDIIREVRERENAPEIVEGFEYLYYELKRLRREKGYGEYRYPFPNRQ